MNKVIDSIKDLKPRQAQFLNLYLQHGNANQAYMQAYNLSPDQRASAIHLLHKN